MRHFETDPPPNEHRVVGQAVAHDSALLHVSGRAHYVDDRVEPANCLHAYPVLSTIAAGALVSIDASQALALAGVIRLITAADIPGRQDIGAVFPGDPLLVETEIRYHGQPILLVIAQSYDLARRAAQLVKLEYQTAVPLLDIHQALQGQSFVRPPHRIARGDVDAALSLAPHRLSGQLHLGGQEHFYLEGQVALAIPQDDGAVHLHCSTQHPTEVQHLTAQVLAKPMHAVTVEMRRMGGGFGGKETQAAQWAVLAALAATQTGRAVKIRLARSDDFRITGKRHPFFNTYEVGFDAEGRVSAADIVVNGHCGHSPDLSDAIVDRAMFHADNAYFYDQVRIVGNRCLSNTASNTAFRGFGGPQGMIVAEALMDDIARALGKDPLAVRRANLYQPGRQTTPYGQQVTQFVVAEMIDRLAHDAQYDTRRAAITAFNRNSPIIKRGLALTPVKFGISFTAQHLNQAGALVHVYNDGSIHLNHGGTEMGQGLNTKVAQIVAQVFGVSLDRVAISATRTDKVPNTSPTAASAGTDLNGMAALDAATKIKDRLLDFVAERYHAARDDIEFGADRVTYPGGELSFAELANLAYLQRISLSANGFYATPKIHYDRELGTGRPFFYFSHGVALSEVEIDILTGESSVTQVDLLHDVGHSINPALDIGQIEGGFIQGMGWLTNEELRWNDQGALLSAGPATYKIPAIGDTPTRFSVQLYASANPEVTVFRSKAVGEPPFMLANSVWCALRDALASLTDYRYAPPLDPPATPEKILQAVTVARHWQKQNQQERRDD